MLFVGFCLLIGLSLVSTVLTIIQQQIEALASVGVNYLFHTSAIKMKHIKSYMQSESIQGKQ